MPFDTAYSVPSQGTIESVEWSCTPGGEGYRGFVNGDLFSTTQIIPVIKLNMQSASQAVQAYTLDVFSEVYPESGATYRQVPLHQSGAPLDSAKREQLLRLLLNGYSGTEYAAFFLNAHVDPYIEPELTPHDAAAVMQMVIWAIQAGGTAFFELQNGDGQSLHAKHTRLVAACEYYYALPGQSGDLSAPVSCAPSQLMVLPDAQGGYRAGPVTLHCDAKQHNIRLAFEPDIPGAILMDALGNQFDATPPVNTPFFIKTPAQLAASRFEVKAQSEGTRGRCMALVCDQPAHHPDVVPLIVALAASDSFAQDAAAWFELPSPKALAVDTPKIQSALIHDTGPQVPTTAGSNAHPAPRRGVMQTSYPQAQNPRPLFSFFSRSLAGGLSGPRSPVTQRDGVRRRPLRTGALPYRGDRARQNSVPPIFSGRGRQQSPHPSPRENTETSRASLFGLFHRPLR